MGFATNLSLTFHLLYAVVQLIYLPNCAAYTR